MAAMASDDDRESDGDEPLNPDDLGDDPDDYYKDATEVVTP
jgi:hypothetical protein